LSPDDFPAAWEEGDRAGHDDDKWKSFIYGKLTNLVLDAHRDLKHQSQSVVHMDVETLATDTEDDSFAPSSLRSDVWEWIETTYCPEVVDRYPRRESRIEAFITYRGLLDDSDTAMDEATIRRAGRGRDDILQAIHEDLSDLRPEGSPATPAAIRTWAESVAAHLDLTRAAARCLKGHQSNMTRDTALRVVACVLMTQDGRMRRARRRTDEETT